MTVEAELTGRRYREPRHDHWRLVGSTAGVP
jgi:hypothetical protein